MNYEDDTKEILCNFPVHIIHFGAYDDLYARDFDSIRRQVRLVFSLIVVLQQNRVEV